MFNDARYVLRYYKAKNMVCLDPSDDYRILQTAWLDDDDDILERKSYSFKEQDTHHKEIISVYFILFCNNIKLVENEWRINSWVYSPP
jgi:hypothetical protein